MYMRRRKFFYSVKLEKKVKKINFINLFGYEVRKIIFLDFINYFQQLGRAGTGAHRR